MKIAFKIVLCVVLAIFAMNKAKAQVGAIVSIGAITGGLADRENQSSQGLAPVNGIERRYEKYQFFPNASAMTDFCMSELKKEFSEIDTEKVHIKHGRNVLLGISNCTLTFAQQ